MKSAIIKRSLFLAGHKTSVSLEDAFWEGLKAIAAERRVSLGDVVSEIDGRRTHGNLSSAIRLHVFTHFDRRGAKQEAA